MPWKDEKTRMCLTLNLHIKASSENLTKYICAVGYGWG